MFKKIICSLLLVSLFTCACQKNKQQDDLSFINDRGRLVVGVRSDAKPFGFTNTNGEFQGYDIDLAKEIAREIFNTEGNIEFVPVTAANRISILNTRQVDIVIAAMSVTDQRQLVAKFSKPYFVSGQALLVPARSDITSLMQLKNRRVIVLFGSTGEKSIRTSLPHSTIIGYKTYLEAFNALKAGQADAMVADYAILKGLAGNNPAFKILPKRYSREPYAVALRRSQKSERLKVKVDYVITKLMETGNLNRLEKKWDVDD